MSIVCPEWLPAEEAVYNRELGSKICYLISIGWSIGRIEDYFSDQPIGWQILWWRQVEPEFKSLWRIARELLAERLAGQMLEIADDKSDMTYEYIDKHGSARLGARPGAAEQKKLQVAARQWLMERYAPQAFQPKVIVDASSDSNSGNTGVEIAVRLIKPRQEDMLTIDHEPMGTAD